MIRRSWLVLRRTISHYRKLIVFCLLLGIVHFHGLLERDDEGNKYCVTSFSLHLIDYRSNKIILYVAGNEFG